MGKCVPLRPPRVGCTFRKAPQRETTSHSKGKFRDVFFESLPIRKARPTLDASGHGTIDLSGPPINKEASSRTAGHEVHREFRTQRRPLNVAFVLRRTVEQETLYPAPPSGDRAVPATASCLDRRRRRTARFHLGRIYGERPPRSWLRYRYRQTRAAPLRESPDVQAS